MRNAFKAIFTLLFFTQITLAQSPWTKEKGKAYLQIGGTSLQYDKIKFDGNEKTLTTNISDITTQVYAECGITEKLETQLIIPFKIISVKPKVGNITNDISGLGNVSLGLKYKLFDKNWKISGGLMCSANSITKDDNKKLSTGFNSSTILPYITAGSSSGKWYYFANLGYGYMDNNYSDFVKFGGEVGYNVIENGHIMLFLDNKLIVKKESAFLNDVTQWPSYFDRQTYSAIGLKFNYEFKKDKFGVNFAPIGAFNLDNVPAALTLNIGVYAKL